MQKILVVDDDTLICDVITIFLEELPGTEVSRASGGRQGAEKLRESHFDLALIDGTLPEISGVALAGIAANEDTPTLLMSGHPQVNDYLERFGFPYLEKPFSLTQLLAESRQIIANAGENVRKIKESMDHMRANMELLAQTIAQSKELLDGIKSQQKPL
jgi:DNA-binding NtrC family response regulator